MNMKKSKILTMVLIACCFEGPQVVVQAACCLPSGQCIATTEQDCTAQGGFFFGDNVNCSTVNCAELDRCCVTGGTCELNTRQNCEQGGGRFLGPGTCQGVNCADPPGACCDVNNVCTNTVESLCRGPGRVFLGAGSTCNNVNCGDIKAETKGVCCVDLECMSLTDSECTAMSGRFLGFGIACDENTCLSVRPCCVNSICRNAASEEVCNALGGFVPAEDNCDFCLNDPDAEQSIFAFLAEICGGVPSTMLTAGLAGLWFMRQRGRCRGRVRRRNHSRSRWRAVSD